MSPLFDRPDPDPHKITPDEAGRYVDSLRVGEGKLTPNQAQSVRTHMSGYLDTENPQNKNTSGIHATEAKEMIDAIEHDPNMHLSESQKHRLEQQTDLYIKEDKRKPFSLF